MRKFLALHVSFPFLFAIAYLGTLLFLTLVLGVKIYVRSGIGVGGTPLASVSGALIFILLFFTATALVWWIVRSSQRQILLAVLFYLAIFQGVCMTLSVLAPYPAWLLASIGVMAILWWSQRVWSHDLALWMAVPGIAVVLGGMLSPAAAIGAAILLSIYDYVAVLRSQLMTGLFRGAAEQHVFFAAIIPQRPDGLRAWLPELQIGGQYLWIGTGDLIIPAMLIVSVLRQGLPQGVGVLVGTLVGFCILHAIFVLRKKGSALPGLPPLVAGAVAGYLVSMLI